MKRLEKYLLFLAVVLPVWVSSSAFASCSSPKNTIEAENCLPGTPQSQWDISGAGDSTIQGFATSISVNQGQTVSFKVNTNATSYKLDIYRLGYYGGNGARLITTVQPSATLPQNQPACLKDSSTGLVDCGNWGVSASWSVPSTATSGIYFAHVIRNDTGGDSHIFFIVRNDSSTSAILFKTSDTTWQAYNDYAGVNLYTGGPGPQGGAYKVSYNRPFHTRVYEFYSWVFNAEYPMVRFLEANGFDVSYFTGVDTDRSGSLILQHKVFMSTGHDEYWSGNQRANVEAARAAGVHLAFFTGNGIFWKTRWENSIDGSNTPYRTMVCYKETHSNRVTDPQDPPTWTGSWRDPRFSPPADGGRPENALQGTIFWINGPQGSAVEIQVPQADGQMRFWRNTAPASLAAGRTYTTSANLLGYEWDIDPDNGFRPAGLFDMSTTSYTTGSNYLLDYGSTYGSGTAVHHLTMYRYNNGSNSALVFGSGTSQWPWALDANHDGGTTTADVNLQQATVNLLADMGVQPASLLGGLVQASASIDTAPPSSTITSPVSGTPVQAGSLITITGTATDTGGGVVAGVEVSVDGGTTWHPASGRGTWTYNWTPGTSGTAILKSRAVDDSGNLETPSAGVTVTVAGKQCPCSIWGTGATPGTIDSGDPGAVELGVRFRADVSGFITGIRFYKAGTNTGTHIGNLWSNSGALLATATFAGESASGWQQVNFASPVAVTANTTYVASYFDPKGHYSADDGFFASAGVDNPPLHALVDGLDGANGAYIYSSTSAFPNSTFQSSNYWVDVVFTTSSGPDTTPPTVVSTSPASGAIGVSSTTTVTATFSEAIDPTTISSNTFQLLGPGQPPEGNTVVPAAVSYSAATQTATLTPTAALAASTNYTAELVGGSTGIKDLAGNALVGTFTWSFTTQPPPGSCPCSIWSPANVPTELDSTDPSAVELGVRFRSDVGGTVSAIRFYKASTNTGTHTGKLWASGGTLLGTATFGGESSSGWQQATFSPPVVISANTTYIASYFAPNGHYSDDVNYFAGSGTDNTPLHALRNGADGPNGVYSYGSTSTFPISTFQSTNYWVDIVFSPSSTTTPPTVTAVTPANTSSGAGLGTAVTAHFSAPMNASTFSNATFSMVDGSNNAVSANVSYDSTTIQATLAPAVELTPSTTYTVTIKGGANGVKDFYGNALSSDYVWSFTTGAPPANYGPGGPILVISSAVNPFTGYYSEILSNEGFNEYTVADIYAVTPPVLSNYDIAILGDMQLTSSQVTMLTNWVNNGGNLIAMHPDKQLASFLGLTSTSGTLSNAYLQVQTATGPGVGIVGQTIQYHGTADLYTLSGASRLATLFSSSSAPTASPAVTLTNAGAGQAAAFTYDLARSVVYTRQGNPAWSGQARDGQSGPIRSDDLYFGAASFDPEPDWVDLTKVAIPQADEQQRLLANLILQMNATKKPLPRFGYFPSGFKAVVVMTGDDHGSAGLGGVGQTIQRFNDFIAASPTGCSVPDWQCIRGTSYLFPQSLASNPLTDAQAKSFNAEGFEIGVHADSNPDCSNWTGPELDAVYTDQLASFASQFPSLPAPQTHRLHCIGWSDYDSQPKVELSHGIRLDTNYYYWPPTWINDQPGLFTGSGMPMRFTDRVGNFINVYQAPTQMTDESGQTYPLNIDTLLNNAVGSSGYYGVFVANMHNDSAGNGPPAWTYPGPGANQIVTSAQAHGVPVVSALQMLTWLDGRNSSSFSSLAWSGNTLSFNITQAPGARNLQALLPTNGPSGTLSSITQSGSPISFTTQVIKGVSYGMFNATSGFYQATYGGGPPAVVLSGVTVNPASVVGGVGSTGTVTLSGPAPSGGAVVTLSSSNASVAQVPASVTVNAGGSSATFSVTTSSVASATQVTIQGTYGSTQGTTLTVVPQAAAISSVTLNPATVIGGASSTGTVTLSAPAPTGGAVVTLSSGNPAATLPASVTVSAGSTSATFTITTGGVASQTTAVITATYGVSASATLTINPAVLSTVTLNPTSVAGGSNSIGTVTLNGVAPAGGAVVTLSSSNTGAAQVPATATISAGSTSTTFTVTTSVVAATATSNISATYGATASATLTVNQVLLSALSLNPTTVVGGNNSTGTVTLNGTAPTGGAVVTLASSNTAAATVAASVTVPAGSTSTTFTVTTLGVAANTSSVITATYGAAKTATVTVNAAALSSVTRAPASVVGGNNSIGTVTLNGAAPPAGAIVTLSSSNTAAAQVPASVTIAGGARSATFTITTSVVTSQTTSTITASYAGVNRTTTLTVNAAALSSVTRTPSSVVGGNNSTGTVTLNGAAPAGGAVITLTSSNTAAAQVPASVTIAGGALSATFTITTSGVASQTTSTITASYAGVNRTTSLTVTVAALSSIALSPSTVTGGTSSTATLTLNGAAPPSGAVVTTASSNTAAAQVPAQVTIPPGSKSITFTVTTSPVTASTTSRISGTYRATTRNATLTVQ